MAFARRSGFDRPLLIAALVLLLIGVIMVFDASGALATDAFRQPFYYLFNQLGGAFGGLVLLFVLLGIRTPLYERKAFVYGLLGLTLFLLALCFAMPEIANTHRWIVLFGVRFQPSELAKVSLIIFLAYAVQHAKGRLSEWRVFIPAAAVLMTVVVLIMLEPDFGTAVLTFLLGALILFLGGAKARNFLGLAAAAVPLFFFFVLISGYRLTRILEFLAKNKDLEKASFQVAQSKLAVGAGGLIGTSFGEGTQKLYFLPCPHTDFIFAVLAEEMGLLGSLLILALFMVVLWRGLAISMKAPTLVSQLAAAGLTFLLAIQALVNITVVLGLSPAKGVPLPLISFGRSSLVCSLMAMAVLLHISQRRAEAKEYL